MQKQSHKLYKIKHARWTQKAPEKDIAKSTNSDFSPKTTNIKPTGLSINFYVSLMLIYVKKYKFAPGINIFNMNLC